MKRRSNIPEEEDVNINVLLDQIFKNKKNNR